MSRSFDPIALGILWDRLISITDEIVETLVRTSFSTNVRESYDLSCVVFDARGRALAQGSYSVPSFTGTAPLTIRHMLDRFPADTLEPGDVIATNDPWLGTGHLFDVNVMRPIFRAGRLVGFTMSITHLPDIGGAGFSAMATQVYEEGLRLPVCKLVRAGRMNEELLEIVRTNVRVPEQTLGDLMANVSCNEVGARMTLEMMDEYGLDELTPLGDDILRFSEDAMRAEVRKIPPGVYRNVIQVEGHEEPVTLACTVTVQDAEVRIDFAGSSPAVPKAINVPYCYTRAFAAYAIKCLTTPKIPNNEGSLRPIVVTAPPGCLLNAVPPSPTGGRHIIGHFVNPLIFGALADALPHRVQGDSGMMNLISVQGTHRDGRGVSSIYFASGGFGALDGMDGAATLPSPSNMTGTPVEIWENLTSTHIEKKVLLPDSGGPGTYRGGLGQEIVLRNDTGHPLTVSCLAGRTEFPPLGRHGGRPGRLREVLINDTPVSAKGRYVLQPGDRLVMREAGGGGFGAAPRSPDKVRQDVSMGFVSREGAARDYGVAVALDPRSSPG
ncbi:MAG TPA: hydantoinase B/oxoprolinase family protein [Candidatus Methylomirabilis sp.]|nr:hydantoinase B/oxoprolinase family protein [Candidatus Methylomirabilis sp.]